MKNRRHSAKSLFQELHTKANFQIKFKCLPKMINELLVSGTEGGTNKTLEQWRKIKILSQSN
jgi:hypothetical protein